MHNIAVIVLAAGNSTRFSSKISKLLHKIGGLEIIKHVIDNTSSCQKTIPVIADEKVQDFINIDCVFQKKSKKGTAAAVYDAIEKVDIVEKYTYICYADMPLISAETLEFAFDFAENHDCTILTNGQKTKNSYGKIAFDESGNVAKIVESNNVEYNFKITNFINAGIIIKTKLLKDNISKIEKNMKYQEFLITDIVELLYRQNCDISLYEIPDCEAYGVNTREDLAYAEDLWQKKMRKKIMSHGVTLVSPDTVFFSHDTKIEKDCVVFPFVYFGEKVIVSDEAVIESFCHLDNVVVSGGKIGPFARIRGKSSITNAKIGNFVEVKNTKVDDGAKIGHLSYIGDADIGKNVNVGAGVITCNYDGFSKNHTKIGDNVFLGAGSIYIAPISISQQTMVAAGSVIYKNIDNSGSLIINRGQQKNIDDGLIKYKKKKEDKCAE